MKKGFTCGVYDLMHVGHLNLFERCKQMCDYLIVGICDDNYVRDIKHKQPIFPLEERVRLVSALKCVDEVVVCSIQETEDKMLAYEKFKFDILFSGDDWKGTPRYLATEKQFAPLGVKIEYLPYTKGISTTDLKQRIINAVENK